MGGPIRRGGGRSDRARRATSTPWLQASTATIYAHTYGLAHDEVSGVIGDSADFIRALHFLIRREDISGVVNVCSPNPVPNRDFVAELHTAWGAAVGTKRDHR